LLLARLFGGKRGSRDSRIEWLGPRIVIERLERERGNIRYRKRERRQHRKRDEREPRSGGRKRYDERREHRSSRRDFRRHGVEHRR
jgi:hypothetical protein